MKELKTPVMIFLVMSLILGIAYPAVMTGIAQAFFPKKANGSLILSDGRVTGSWLLGQNFSNPKYFHGRPSASNYDALNSGGSNYGPTNKKFIDAVSKLSGQVRNENGLPADGAVPSDLVLASGSGLDPHIAIKSALIQSARIARERNISETDIISLVKRCAEPRYFGIYGDKIINVLRLNNELDGLSKRYGRGL